MKDAPYQLIENQYGFVLYFDGMPIDQFVKLGDELRTKGHTILIQDIARTHGSDYAFAAPDKIEPWRQALQLDSPAWKTARSLAGEEGFVIKARATDCMIQVWRGGEVVTTLDDIEACLRWLEGV